MERSPRLELAVELFLLVGGVVYLVVMLGYPRNAGMVPAIATVVMIGTVVVQMVRRHLLRERHTSPPEAAHIDEEPEFDGLIGDAGMDAAARRRLATVGVWTVVVVLAVQLVGFVVGGVLSVLAFQLLARQPVRILAVTAVVVALGVFAITDLVIGIPWNDAPLLQTLMD